jgi:hypothetical protein
LSDCVGNLGCRCAPEASPNRRSYSEERSTQPCPRSRGRPPGANGTKRRRAHDNVCRYRGRFPGMMTAGRWLASIDAEVEPVPQPPPPYWEGIAVDRPALTPALEEAKRANALPGSGRRLTAGATSTAVLGTTESSSAQLRISAGTKRTVPPIFRNGMQCVYCQARTVLVETARNRAASWTVQRGSSSMPTLRKKAVNLRGGDAPLAVKLYRSEFATVNPGANRLWSYGQDIREFLCGEVRSPRHRWYSSSPLPSCQGGQRRLTLRLDVDSEAVECRGL